MGLIDSLLDSEKYTKLEIENARRNLQVAEGNEDKLECWCQAEEFALLTMQLGNIGTPGYFQYFIHGIFLTRIGKATAAYLEDLMLYTKKGVDHEQAVAKVC